MKAKSKIKNIDTRSIKVTLIGLDRENGNVKKPKGYNHATFRIDILIDNNTIDNYLNKQLTIEDLNNIINNRL
jgi:hypothetical protein